MKVLVTGADGFVGSWLVPRLVLDGHEIVAAVRAGVTRVGPPWPAGVIEVPWEIGDRGSVRELLDRDVEAVIHLAAVASGGDALRDPDLAFDVNVRGTARLAEALAARHGRKATLLFVSSAEVYGVGTGVPRLESDPRAPVSPYAESKAAAEEALSDVAGRTGLNVIVARSFAHTGARQDARFVIPAFARRIVEARRLRAGSIAVGNLSPVRDVLHVSDVVDAYCRLMVRGAPGEVYNVASGTGVALAEVFARLSVLAGWTGQARATEDLFRPADIAHLVGDAEKLKRATGWQPVKTLDETLTEVLRAQEN